MDNNIDIADDYSSIVNTNAMLLQFEGWIKFIEGYIRGIDCSGDKVNSGAVLECLGEVLEYMHKFKTDLIDVLMYCDQILAENDKLKGTAIVVQEEDHE